MSKEQFFEMREKEINQLVESVKNGDVRALPTYAGLKKHLDYVSGAVKEVEDSAFNEAYLYGEKSFEDSGFKFEIRNGAKRYSFKNIPEWLKKQEELKEIEERAKSAFIAKQKGMLTATEDGEEIILPELSISKDSLVVKSK